MRLRFALWGLLGVAVVAVALGGWFRSEQTGHPFGDPRACAGSDAPLREETDVLGIALPEDARDMHYVTHRDVADGGVELSAAFRSTRAAMLDYLRDQRIADLQPGKPGEPGGPGQLDDGRYPVGDVGPEPASVGLCGGMPPVRAPAVEIGTSVLEPGGAARLDVNGVAERVVVDMQTEQHDRSLVRHTTDVVVTVYRDDDPVTP